MHDDGRTEILRPFPVEASERVRRHPDTPAAYVRWSEILPLLNRRWATEVGNRLGWSVTAAGKTIGASHALLRAWLGVDDGGADTFMLSLAETPVIDFIDSFLPFLMNLSGIPDTDRPRWLQAFQSGDTAGDFRLPDNVLVELTQSCNYSCVMCSHRGGGFDPSKTMPLPVFGELVRRLSPHASSIRINGYGESALIPNLASYLDCFAEFGYRGHREIITNLSGETSIYERMIRDGYALIVSWDAADKDLFERIRRGSDFDRLTERLRRLCRLTGDHPEQVVLLCTVQELNCHAIPDVVDLAHAYGAGALIFNMVKEDDGSPWMERRFSEVADLFSEAAIRAETKGISLSIPDHIGPERLHLRCTSKTSAYGCDRPWKEVLIRYDLELQPCNMFNPYSYGLLQLHGWELDMGQRFDKLWNSGCSSLFRTLVNSQPRHPYCDRCYWLQHRSDKPQ